ncbi:MAG: FtsX-like permease family protein [Erysipelotrichaceae bacterium]|nr:FtsX-like permease family protein [Erysipelotrichaceae bacterium]
MKELIRGFSKKYWKLLLSTALVSALSCGVMTGLQSGCLSIEDSLYDYVEDYHYPQAIITSEVRDRSILKRLNDLDEIKLVNARLCGDTIIINNEGRYLSARVFSYNFNDAQKFYFWEKTDPQSQDSIYVDYNFAHDNNIEVGQLLSVKIGDEYRKYFVEAIVSMPEGLSVRVSDNGQGSSSDFGYVYASADLLRKEYEKVQSENELAIKDKQDLLNEAKTMSQEALLSNSSLLEQAKDQLSSYQATYDANARNVEQLRKMAKELKDNYDLALAQKKQLNDLENTIDMTVSQLEDQISLLNQAIDGLNRIDESINELNSQRDTLISKQTEEIIDYLETRSDRELASLFENIREIRDFVSLAMDYGFNYDVSEQYDSFAQRAKAFIDRVEGDHEYLSSDNTKNLVIKIADGEEVDEEEYRRLCQVISRYAELNTSDIVSSYNLALNNEEYLHNYIINNRISSLLVLLRNFASSSNLYELFEFAANMESMVSTLAQASGMEIHTTHDLAKAYRATVNNIDDATDRLYSQRQDIVDQLHSQGIDENELPSLVEQAKAGIDEAASYREQIADGIRQVDEVIPQLGEYLKMLNEALEKADSQLSEADSKLQEAKNTINEAETQIAQARAEAMKEFADLENELAKAIVSLEEGKGYDYLCNQFMIYFNKGVDEEKALEKIRNIISEDTRIKSSYLFEDSGVKHRIDINVEPIREMVNFIPVIFFGITMIVVFLFMSLIIKQSRREIGILRALGFSKGEVTGLFCGMMFMTSLLGSLLGLFVGLFVFYYLSNYFKDFFPLPIFSYTLDIRTYILSIIITIFVGQLATLICARTISSVEPSEAMSRTVNDEVVVPEKLDGLLSKLHPLLKFSITSLLRNRSRLIFSIICVAASVIMIFSSLSFISSKNKIVKQLFEDRIHYDCQIFYNEKVSDEYLKELKALDYIEEAEKLNMYSKEISFDDKTFKASIYAMDNNELFSFHDEKDDRLFLPEEGIILEKYLAEKLGVKIGDRVIIEGNSFEVKAISYQSSNRYQYISMKEAERLGDIDLVSLIVKMKDGFDQTLMKKLIEEDNYLYSVFTTTAYRSTLKLFDTFNAAAYIIIGFSIIIGLVIIVNIAQTNLLEKKRELSVLRTLGFQHREVSLSWFFQSLIHLFTSCMIGLPLGGIIARIALKKLGTDTRDYVYANGFKEYMLTILLVFGYIIIGHLYTMNLMKKWNLVENVKDKE